MSTNPSLLELLRDECPGEHTREGFPGDPGGRRSPSLWPVSPAAWGFHTPRLPFWHHSLPRASRPHFGYGYWILPELLADHLKWYENAENQTNHFRHKGSVNGRISGTFIHGRYFWSGETFLLLKEANCLHPDCPLAISQAWKHLAHGPIRSLSPAGSGLSRPHLATYRPSEGVSAARWQQWGIHFIPEEIDSSVFPIQFINRTNYSLILLYICNSNN